MRSAFHLMEDAWTTYFKNFKVLFVIPALITFINIIPFIAFPWAITATTPAPNVQIENIYSATIIIISLLNIGLWFLFLFEVWRILKKTKTPFEKSIELIVKRLPSTIGSTLSMIGLTIAGGSGYILLYWLLSNSAILSNEAILSWPLILGIPLLFPALYLLVRYFPAPYLSLLYGKPVKNSLKISEKLIDERWWPIATRFFIPIVLWSLLGVILLSILVLLILLFLATNPQSIPSTLYILLIFTETALDALIISPLATISTLLLFSDLK